MGLAILEMAGELYSAVWFRIDTGFILEVSGAAVNPEEVQGFQRALSLTKQTQWNFCHCWCRRLSDRAA